MFICSFIFFFFKQKTAYEMRISDWSSDVCSSDLLAGTLLHAQVELLLAQVQQMLVQLVGRLVVDIFAGHHITARVTNWVCTESLAAARRNASRAVVSSTPSTIGRASCRDRGCQYV